MDGPSTLRRWQPTSRPSRPKKSDILCATCNRHLAENNWRKSLAFSCGQPPLYIMLAFYSPPFIATSLLVLPPNTACAQHFGNISWIVFNDDAIISRKYDLHLPVGAKVTEFRRSTITSKNQLPKDNPIEKHVWVRTRDPHTIKRKLSKESKATVLWILDSLLPLLSTIPLNRFCNLHIQAAADAFATDDTMGIGGWVTIQSSTFWFSETWTKHDSSHSLTRAKDLQKCITSWDAFAQLCIILTVHQNCEPRPGLIDIQSDLTTQMQKPTSITVSLLLKSSTRLSNRFQWLNFAATPYWMYITSQERRTLMRTISVEVEPLLFPTSGKSLSISIVFLILHLFQGAFTVPHSGQMFFSPSFSSFLRPLFFSFAFLFSSLLSPSLLPLLPFLFAHLCHSAASLLGSMRPVTIVKRFRKGETLSIPVPPGIIDDALTSVSQSPTRQQSREITSHVECQTLPTLQPL